MFFSLDAACGCNMGKRRQNNEDNFLFLDQHLPEENGGLPEILTCKSKLGKRPCFSVFDGLGGENFGESASFSAAKCQLVMRQKPPRRITPKYLVQMVQQLNDAVMQCKREHFTEYMGTTMVSLIFTPWKAHICNVGDSRAYLLRKTNLQQLSVDHIAQQPANSTRKAPLTQSLGLDPEEITLQPHFASVALRRGDRFLLCSDGLTDMLTDAQIAAILQEKTDAKACAEALIQGALEAGGKDNITVVIMKGTGE